MYSVPTRYIVGLVWLNGSLSGGSETGSTTYDSHDVSVSDSSFQVHPASSTSHRRHHHRVSFVDDTSWKKKSTSSTSSASRRPPLPPSRPPRHDHQPQMTVDPRSRRHLLQRARQRATRSRSWHSLTTPDTSTERPSSHTTPHNTSFRGAKLRFLSQLFSKKSSPPPSAVDMSASADNLHPVLRPALRASNLSRSASAGRIADTGSSSTRPARTVRWDISPDMDKPAVVLPMWKRPKKVFDQESSVWARTPNRRTLALSASRDQTVTTTHAHYLQNSKDVGYSKMSRKGSYL